jgi:nicotinate dehydrogenase subunit B
LHSTRPDNVIRNILDGIRTPATADIGFMPAFRHSLSDEQVAALAGYMRSRYAPGQPAWPDLTQAVSRLRALPGSH